ncbi:valine--tRNA ligase [Metamycoplasma phocicerebrale]|nr:valine--tRNA ligase [Metamycoplasma phocicerebrale]
MGDNKIVALRIIDLKKRVKQTENNIIKYKIAIENVNLLLSKSSILGIIGSRNDWAIDNIFTLLIDNNISPKKYQGFIEYKLDNENKFIPINKRIDYQKNLAFGFDNENIFKSKTNETVFSYLEKYIKKSEVIAALTKVFDNNWNDIYQDSRFHLGAEYFKNNFNLQQEISSIITELKEKIASFDIKNLKTMSIGQKISFISEINNLQKEIIKKIQYNEKEFFAFLEKTIENYHNGDSLLQYKEYRQAKKTYLEMYNKKNVIKSRANTNIFFNKIKSHIEKSLIKLSKKNEIRKYFAKIKNDFAQEIKFTKFELSKRLRGDSFLHHYSHYYISKIYYKFIKKYHYQIMSLDQSNFMNFVEDIYTLRDLMISEIQTSVGSSKSNMKIKREVKFVANSMFLKNSRMYIDRFKYYKKDDDDKITKEIMLKNNSLSNTTDNFLDIAQLKQYEYNFLEKQAEYHWNVDTEGKKIRNQAKKYYSDTVSTFIDNNKNLKIIKSRIYRFLKEIFYLEPELLKQINENELISTNLLVKVIYDLRELSVLLFDLFNQYHDYKKFIEGSTRRHSSTFYKLILKSSIYKILDYSKIPLDKLTLNLPHLSQEEKVELELQKILINKPSLIILGPKIHNLKKELQISIIKRLNEYTLDNECLAIYFLDDINVASKITNDIYIINGARVIEQGKTNKVLENPINPLSKVMMGKLDGSNPQFTDYIKSSKEYMNVFKYEIEEDHIVWCKWDELSKWAKIEQISNQELKKIFKIENASHSENKEFLDKSTFSDFEMLSFNNLNNNRKEKKMDKSFDHNIVEKNRNQKWIDMKAFSTHDLVKPPFTIILPPPNVTGKLHIGHALDNYIPDTIIRYKKMKGYDVMWVAGKDHAGIATQAVVEKKLASEGINKYKLGRDKFIQEIWKWKEEYSNNINKQWGKLGLALDYTSERFTLDEGANEAVMKVFIDLYNEGLIYRDTKPISWDVNLKTALSNIEVISTEIKQKMYYVKYPIKDTEQYLIVATTRPETMFSDVALALNPQDERFQILKSAKIIHPLTQNELPIISSESIDPNFGTGIMKVSAHAIDDIEIIKENNLEIRECIDDEGKMNANAGALRGTDRFEARELIAYTLESKGYISKIENIVSNVGYSERSKTPVEVLVKKQWFVKMKTFSEDLLKNLQSANGVKIKPIRFEESLKKWMENVYDWTISRQIWWGHRIPAWYKDNKVLVQIENPGPGWKQDPDVLDTWFSSALAPFAFLGWPKNDTKLKRYFPTNLLVTGYDIIFFWVSRMYFQSLHFMNEKPFDEVLLHGIVRDSQGRKMSKSLGNGIDPISFIDEHGSDVLRMSLVFNCTPGQDINFNNEKIQASRLFINKFWNIARLISNIPVNLSEKLDINSLDQYDLWILNEFNYMNKNIYEAMKNYEFTVVYKYIQDFVINKFSSWYLEFLKFKNNNLFIHYLFREILITLHPYMPFLTDYLFETIYNEELLETDLNNYILSEDYDSKEINNLIELITILRKYREDKQISKAQTLGYSIEEEALSKSQDIIVQKLSNFVWKENKDFSIQSSFGKIYIEQRLEDKENEIIELQKLIKTTKAEIEFNEKFINNPKFIEKASPEKVKEKRDKLDLHKKNLEIYQKQLDEKQK